LVRWSTSNAQYTIHSFIYYLLALAMASWTRPDQTTQQVELLVVVVFFFFFPLLDERPSPILALIPGLLSHRIALHWSIHYMY